MSKTDKSKHTTSASTRQEQAQNKSKHTTRARARTQRTRKNKSKKKAQGLLKTLNEAKPRRHTTYTPYATPGGERAAQHTPIPGIHERERERDSQPAGDELHGLGHRS